MILCFFSWTVQAWNALGHRLVVQIALDNLNTRDQKALNHFHHQLDGVYQRRSLVNAAPWMDTLRYDKELWMIKKHFINIPFSLDNTPLVQPLADNAVNAINQARNVLFEPQSSPFDKGFSLRILLHVVGDLHQPLHSTSQFSQQFPHGDMGGNLVKLGFNPVANNLHAYWDRGGGLLVRARVNQKQLKKWAHRIELHYPCRKFKKNVDPAYWAMQSHQLAVHVVYQLKMNQVPTKAYQRNAKKWSERQIALAGCRLAAVLSVQ